MMSGFRVTHWPIPLLVFALTATPASGQEFEAEPYVQLLSTSDVWILWEGTTEGQVHWGPSAELGTSVSGSVIDGDIQEAHLEGLDPQTRYYYQVRLEGEDSDVQYFTTPPADREAPFRFVSMSDVQVDGANPDKYDEVIHDGIIDYIGENYGTELDQELAYVLLPGDLVADGWDQDQWRDTFLAPGHDLMAQVPFYPVLGNHEANSDHFFNYLHLPSNAEPGWEEHCYTLDQGNTRIIGLDSNALFASQPQLDWLGLVLDDACGDEDLDFVFAQLHHPWKSELWPPGELDFTGEVIALLDEFSTVCGKPAMHLFGHTHGYSRGQSRDHVHLWVNVAAAGGNIDYWGEYAQIDYEEFTVSQDEYGFVVVEVTAGEDPAFLLRRIGRGDEYETQDNVQRDEVLIRRYNLAPADPEARAPLADEQVSPDCINLIASPWCDPDDDLQGASQWQVASSCSDFSAPILDRWVQHQNWYNQVDLQAGDHLGDQMIPQLPPSADYCWRVRQRDRSLVWSGWSQPVPFSTGASALSPNLLVNGGAEQGLEGWTAVEGPLEVLTDGECGGTTPYAGDHYFGVGGVCDGQAYGEARQDVDVSDHAAAIDDSTAVVRFGGMFADWAGSDLPEAELVFVDAQGGELATSSRLWALTDSWTQVLGHQLIPPGTRTIRFVLMGTRNDGQDNDSYFDDLNLQIATDGSLDICVQAPAYPFDDEPTDCTPTGDDDDAPAGDDDDGTGCTCRSGGSVYRAGRAGVLLLLLLGLITVRFGRQQATR